MSFANEIVICPYCKKRVTAISAEHLWIHHKKSIDYCKQEFPFIPPRHFVRELKKDKYYYQMIDEITNRHEDKHLVPILDNDLMMYLGKYGSLRGSCEGNSPPNATTIPVMRLMKERKETLRQTKEDYDNNPKKMPSNKSDLERREKRQAVINQETQKRMTKIQLLELEYIKIQRTIDEFIAENGIDYLGQCTMLLIEEVLHRNNGKQSMDATPNEKLNLIMYINKVFNEKIQEVG